MGKEELKKLREKIEKAVKEALAKPPRTEIIERIRAVKRTTKRDRNLWLD